MKSPAAAPRQQNPSASLERGVPSYIPTITPDDLLGYELLSTPIWVFSHSRLCHVWANQAALKFWRADSLDEFLSRDLTNISDGANARLMDHQERLLGGESSIAEQWTLYPKGQARTVNLFCRGLHIEPFGFVMLYEAAVTDNKEIATENLRGLEALRHIPHAVGVFNAEQRLLFHNPAFSKEFDLDQRLSLLFSDSQTWEQASQTVADHIAAGLEAPLNLKPGHKGGQQQWFEIGMRRTADPATGQDTFLFTAIDISERREAQQRAEEALQKLEAANQAKSDFLARMSHELRSPLNAVMGFSSVIRDGLLGPCSPPRYAEYAKDIFSAAELLLDLINDLLDYTRIEMGGVNLSEERVDLHKLADTVSTLVRTRAEKADIEIRNEIAADLPNLFADQRGITQVLLNLMTNAVKFTEKGGNITLRIHPGPAGTLIMQVEDTGIGIAPEDLPTITEPFNQGQRHAHQPAEGTGLGLSIVKALSEAHGATFTLESQQGVGTLATIAFPRDRTLKNKS